MGSFSCLTVDNYAIFWGKNSYSEEIVNLLFLPKDFIKEKRKLSNKYKLLGIEDSSNEKGTYTFKGFKQTVKHCKQRLEIFGMSLKEARNDFNDAKRISKDEGFYSFSIKKISFESYLDELKDIVLKQEKSYEELFTSLRESLIAGDLGIYGQTIKAHLYSILSVLPEDAIIEYDLTALLDSGWVKEKNVKEINIEKIIVLAEGRTDVEFISGILSKNYPELFDYYHFIDFDEYKVESNASALVKLVTSLVASNIKHPIIVIFDNDTTGIMEMKRRKNLHFPDNIKVLKYPDLNSAKKYPTIVSRVTNWQTCKTPVTVHPQTLTNPPAGNPRLYR